MTTSVSAQQSEYLAAAPVSVQGIVQRAFEGSASPRQAIKAKCLTCCNYDRNEVEHCTVVRCPLWAYRPYTAKSSQPALHSEVVPNSAALIALSVLRWSVPGRHGGVVRLGIDRGAIAAESDRGKQRWVLPGHFERGGRAQRDACLAPDSKNRLPVASCQLPPAKPAPSQTGW